MKKALYELFSPFGPILDIVASKGVRLRGQAWIVYRDLDAASAAKRALHDSLFFDKAVQIQFAKSKSDVVAKADGSYVRRTEPKRPANAVNREADPEKRAAKKRALEAKSRGAAAAAGGAGGAGSKLDASFDNLPPNKLLFVDNLPDECTELMLAMLFRQYEGFAEVRMVPGKAGIAFVEFADPLLATTAKNALQGFKITADKPMRVSFAKQ